MKQNMEISKKYLKNYEKNMKINRKLKIKKDKIKK